MADDDEIDVLGDFNLDILSKNDSNMFDGSPLVSQNSDLLNCDYTIHPQWLLDRPPANHSLWYGNSDLDIGQQFEYATSSGEPHVSTENSITDESGWTEKEKNLLHRGIEIFGTSNVNLSQFIGSRTPLEVKYFLKNFYSDVQMSHSSLNEDIIFDNGCAVETVTADYTEPAVDEILDDNQIPASIEVIAVVSTAKPTLVGGRKRNSPKKSPDLILCSNEIPTSRSLLKPNFTRRNRFNGARANPDRSLIRHKKSVKFKFKTKLKMNHKNETVRKVKTKKVFGRRRQSTKSESEGRVDTTDVLIVTGNGLAVPVCEGEEVIKIRKESETENSDSDIDVEDENDCHLKVTPQKVTKVLDDEHEVKASTTESTMAKCNSKSNASPVNKAAVKKVPLLSDLDEATAEELLSMEHPKEELLVKGNEISEVEKFVFYEYFEDRPTKTPMRYLRIRNHILSAWNSSKPNYVTKTSIRHGLRQCGDVNCIGRIHGYLEQIGAINFGCEQTVYSRPLFDLAVQSSPKDKTAQGGQQVAPQKIELAPRQRNKKKYVNDGEGGYTLTHDERGGIINTTVVNEEPTVKQRASYIKKPTIRLIYCRSFNNEKPQEYTIHLELSALILMDLHAHMHLTEVMGLIGGQWSSHLKKLTITRYIPCKNIAPSTTHCDMCPITQARAADILHGENLDILGWYHSHPTFAPEPSQQDLDTQVSVQQWIGTNKPCIGFILSPFSLHGALIASPFRCLIVDKKDNFEDQFVPYRFKVELITERLNVSKLLKEARKVILCDSNETGKSKVDFRKIYFQDHSITYLDKFIYSVKMHLAKCSDINKMTCDAVIEGLTDLCTADYNVS